MISSEDCIALCGLENREIAAVAEHEHIPETAAAALAGSLLRKPDGAKVIRQFLVENIERAMRDNRLHHATELFSTLRRFINRHPEASYDFAHS